MAGGVLKGLGGVLLTLGILLLLAGAGAAAYGLYDEQQNKDQGGPLAVAHDPKREERNQQTMAAGGVGAAAGLVLLVLGIIFLASGSGRANRALAQAARAGAAGSAAVSTAPQASPASARPRRGKTGLVVGAAVAAGLVLAAVLAIALGNPGASGLLRGDPAGAQQRGEASLGVARLEGRVSSGPTVAGGSQLVGDGKDADPFSIDPAARQVKLTGAWRPGTACCASLQFDLQQRQGGGWVEVDTWVGVSGEPHSFTVDPSLGLEFRFLVWPGEDGLSQGQDFSLDVSWWA